MASAAAARLQDLLQSFISHNLDHGVKKLVPDSCGEASSYTTVLDAAGVLANLPFYAASLQPLWCVGSTSAVTNVLTKGAPEHTENIAFAPVLQFLGGVVERHLCTLVQDVSMGPSFMRLNPRASEAHTPASSVGSLKDEGEYHSNWMLSLEVAASSGFDGCPQVNFVAWVALEVYRHLAAAAESSLRERRRVGCGADAPDAAVRTDAYVQWQRMLQERLVALLHPATGKETGVNKTGSAADTEKYLSQKDTAAAPAVLSRDLYDNTDDLFTSEPHFFSSFMRQHLLPYVKQRVTERAVPEEGAGSAEELRRWVRFPTSTTSPPVPCSNAHDAGIPTTREEQGEASRQKSVVSVPKSSDDWRRLVQLLLGSSITPMLDGSDVYEANGLLRPQTPVHVAAYVAAAVAVFLVPGVMSPMTRWLDRILSSDQHSCGSSPDGETRQRICDEECVAAMHRALDVCTRSMQVVPFPLCDGRDADLPAGVQLAGGWLLAASSSAAAVNTTSLLAVTRQDTHGQRVKGQHRAVVLPGLSIAATRIRSVGCGFPLSQGDDSVGAAPDAITPAGTCVVSPALALAQLCVGDAQLDAAVLAPCCDATRAATTTAVSALHESSLCCVERLLLFTELPDEVEPLKAILASVNASVPSGWVVFVVQASVAKATQVWIESVWGTVERPVLLLSAVGQWGLQQLSLRFDVEANTPCTHPRALRGVQRSAEKPSGTGSCGVTALFLHSHESPRPVSTTAADARDLAQRVTPHRSRRRQQIQYTELREQLLFVVGAVPCGRAENTVREGASSSKQPLGPSEVGASSGPTLVTQPPAMSMFFTDTSEDEDEETASSADLCNTTRSSFSTHSNCTMSLSREGAARKMVEWYSNAEISSFPFVTHSVLLGAVSRDAQRELMYHFWYWWRLLLHRLVLPHELSSAVDAQGVWGANVTAIRYLDTVVRSVGSTEVKHSVTPQPSGVDICRLRRLHLLRVLREALWSYELLAKQQDGEGQSLDRAWATLQRWVMAGDTLDSPMTRPATHGERHQRSPSDGELLLPSCSASTESWLQVQSAFIALGNCIDDLCRTVVLAADAENGERATSDIRDLLFLPMV